jgi:hypothetical protein
MLQQNRPKKFSDQGGLRDWSMLVELLLEWEAYLCLPKLKKAQVQRLGKKHRYIMYIIKSVAKRTKGMGLKLMKFHAIVHLVQDMILYGVCSEFDTGSNESHHKPSKQAAKLTQRKEATFQNQTATRLAEFHTIELAMAEIDHKRRVCDYFEGALDADAEGGSDTDEEPNGSGSEPDDSDDEATAAMKKEMDAIGKTGGTRIKIYEDPDDNMEAAFAILGKSKKKDDTTMLQSVLDFLNELQNKVLPFIHDKELQVFTEHKRGDIIFRGHPNHRGDGPWKDWVRIDWGKGYGIQPSRIWCFVELQNMPKGRGEVLKHGGIDLADGTYAVVEVAEYEENPAALKSDLFIPLLLDTVPATDDDAEERVFYLANTEAFVAPCCVVPDIGGLSNRYFEVKARGLWSKEFAKWLDLPHNMDVMQPSDDEADP